MTNVSRIRVDRKSDTATVFAVVRKGASLWLVCGRQQRALSTTHAPRRIKSFTPCTYVRTRRHYRLVGIETSSNQPITRGEYSLPLFLVKIARIDRGRCKTCAPRAALVACSRVRLAAVVRRRRARISRISKRLSRDWKFADVKRARPTHVLNTPYAYVYAPNAFVIRARVTRVRRPDRGGVSKRARWCGLRKNK